MSCCWPRLNSFSGSEMKKRNGQNGSKQVKCNDKQVTVPFSLCDCEPFGVSITASFEQKPTKKRN